MLMLLLLVCFSFLCAQEENVVVDAKSLANIVMEVNELKESNKKLSREVSFLKERVLGTTKPFSVLQNGRYIVPLIIRTPEIATHGEIDPLKIQQLCNKIAGNLHDAKIIAGEELQQSRFITELLAEYTKRLPYRFWYLQFSFSLLRRDWEAMPFRTKLYTKNLSDFTRYYLITKNGGSLSGYRDRDRITEVKAQNNFSIRECNTISACLFANFAYDVKTQYRYIPLFYEGSNGEEVVLKSPFSLSGFPIVEAKVHPQSVIFLEVEKNSPQLWEYLETLQDISIGPCVILPKEYNQLQRKQLCFSVDRHRSKIDDIAYDYTFEADNMMIVNSDVSVQKHSGDLQYRVWVPRNAKIFTIRMGYFYEKFDCREVWPGIHLTGIKRVSLPALQKHLEQFVDLEKRSTCLVKALGMSKPSRKIDSGLVDEIKDFVSYLNKWSNARSSRVSNIIEKFTNITNKTKQELFMKNLFILLLPLIFIGQVMAKDFSRSDKKKIDKAFAAAKLAEEGKTGTDFKKGYKTVKSAIKSLKRKYADHPQVLELEKRFVVLEQLVPHENARADLEKSLKKVQINLKKVANGIASAKKKLQKDAISAQMSMVHLKMTENERFSSSISAAEKVFAEAKEHGIELRSEEEVIAEIKLQQSMLDLTRSQLSAIKKIEKSISKAEQKDQFSQIKKEMDHARKLLEPLSEALPDNLKIKSLQQRCENLEGKLSASKVAFDLRDDLKKLDANVKTADKAKDFDKIDRAMSSAKEILAKVAQQDLTDNEDIEKQIDEYKERVEGLEGKFNSLKLVSETKDDMKKLSYKIPFAEKSFDYRKVKSSMEEAKPILEKLNNKDNLQDNDEIATAVKDYTQRFAKLEEKIVFCKKDYDLIEQVEQLNRDMRDLFRTVERAQEQKQLPITASSDKYQIMGNAKALKEAITLTPQFKKKYQQQMTHAKNEMEILQKRNGEAFSRTIGKCRELVDAWQNAMESEKPVYDHGMQQAKQMYTEQEKGMTALYAKIGSFKEYPKEHLKELETFLTETSMNVWSYMSPFAEHKDFSDLVKKSNTLHEDGKKYFELIRTTKYLHSSLESGDLGLAKYRLKEVHNTQHEESKKVIAFYDAYLERWEAAKKDLNNIYSAMLERLAKSSSSLNGGFEKFRGKYTVIPANRTSIIKDLNANVGKAVKDMTREKLSYSTAWKLNHGDDLFYYALEQTLAQRAATFYEQLKEKFNAYRLQVAKKHNVEERGLPYWTSPGYVDIDMVAIVDTTVSHTPRIAIKDQTGTIKGYVDGTSIQIVKVSVVGLRSKYFTMWQNSPQQQTDVSGLYK